MAASNASQGWAAPGYAVYEESKETVPERVVVPEPVVELVVPVVQHVAPIVVEQVEESLTSMAAKVMLEVAFPKCSWYDKWIRLRKLHNPESLLYKPDSFEIPHLLREIKELKDASMEDVKTAEAPPPPAPPASSSSSSSSSSYVPKGIPEVTRHQMKMVYDPNCKFKRVDI